MLYRKVLLAKTKRGPSSVDLTQAIKDVVKESGVEQGLCHVYLKATTAGLAINERDLLLLKDMERFFSKLVPEDRLYAHPENAFSHIRASLLKQSLVIPVEKGELVLGTWQSILLFEFDVHGREREVVVTVIGSD